MRARCLELTTVVWRKSSYSDAQGGDCVEVASWRKSTYSNNTGGDCLEVADSVPDMLPVRDSKNPDAAVLLFRSAAWGAFLTHLR